MMLTMQNTDGRTQADLDRCNSIAAAIAAANPSADAVHVSSAVLGNFDPEMSDACIEHWAMSDLDIG